MTQSPSASNSPHSESHQTEKVKSSLISKNVTVLKKRTSIRLEPEIWDLLCETAQRENCSIHSLCSLVQLRKSYGSSLTSAIRVFVTLYYRAATTKQGHIQAEHGDYNNMLQRARLDDEDMSSLLAIPPAPKQHPQEICHLRSDCHSLCPNKQEEVDQAITFPPLQDK